MTGSGVRTGNEEPLGYVTFTIPASSSLISCGGSVCQTNNANSYHSPPTSGKSSWGAGDGGRRPGGVLPTGPRLPHHTSSSLVIVTHKGISRTRGNIDDSSGCQERTGNGFSFFLDCVLLTHPYLRLRRSFPRLVCLSVCLSVFKPGRRSGFSGAGSHKIHTPSQTPGPGASSSRAPPLGASRLGRAIS